MQDPRTHLVKKPLTLRACPFQVSRVLGPAASLGTSPINITVTSQDPPPAVKPLLYWVIPTGKQASFVSPILKKPQLFIDVISSLTIFLPSFTKKFLKSFLHFLSPRSLFRLYSSTSANPSGQCQ